MDEIAAQEKIAKDKKLGLKPPSKLLSANTGDDFFPTLETTDLSISNAIEMDNDALMKPEDPKEKRKTLLMKLFTESGDAKLQGILDHIGIFLDNPISGKLLIFAHHRVVLDRLQQYVTSKGIETIRIDGRTNSKERQIRAQLFQTSATCRVAILSITAAGIAITLTAAATVYFAEIFWTPGSLIQSEDRAHRIGQTNTVTITYFLADDTIDELLWPLVRQKMKTLGEVVEGEEDIDMDINKDSSKKVATKKLKRSTSTNSTIIEENSNENKNDKDEQVELEDDDDDDEDETNDLELVVEEIAVACTDRKKTNLKRSLSSDDVDNNNNDDEDGKSFVILFHHLMIHLR